MPTQPAVLGSARLNNFRLNYLTPALAHDRPSHVWIIIGGIDVTNPTAPMRVIYKSLTIRDLLFDAPNTCALTLYGAAVPNVGEPIEVWINSNAPQLLFNGELQTVDRTYKGRVGTVLHPVTAIDDTARANRLRPLRPYVNVSATTVAQDLIATYCPGFSSAGVEANLPPVTVNFDGSEGGLKGCLTQIAKLVGGYWYFENKTLYLFVTPPGPAPDPIDDTPGRFLHEPQITWSMDKSQVRTRVYGKGASTAITASIAAATSLVPVRESTMFNPLGGKAILGTAPDGAASRVVTYTGVQPGGTGSLVGPGAAPGAPPLLALVDGAGMEAGAHSYVYAFVTAAGESLPSPAAAITVGLTAPPATAPVPGSPTAGGAVDAGTHYYAVTFVTASGETTSTPPGTPVVTTPNPGGVPAPTVTNAALRNVIGNLANGVNYRYKTTFTTASGETLPSPIGNTIQSQPPPFPTSVPNAAYYDVTGAMAPGGYRYGIAYVAGGYETLVQVPSAYEILSAPYNAVAFTSLPVSPDARVTVKRLYRSHVNGDIQGAGGAAYLVAELPNLTTSYTDTKSDAQLGPLRTGTGALGTPPGNQATVTVPTSADGRVVGRKLYRSDATDPWRFLVTIHNNTETTYTDNTASVSTDPDAPITDTTGGVGYQTVPIAGIPTGPGNVTARKLYRYSGAGPYKLLATIANNTATTYTDAAPSSSLGANMPGVNTATGNKVSIGVAIGPAAVTGRRLYRTKANSGTLYFLTTILENTSTAYVDAFADAALSTGVLPPTIDTSGLQQPSGQVPAGSTSMIVATGYPFYSTGGWAVVGNGEQVIRYSGATATALTGIPATGPGAIVTAVSYNSMITAAPTLMGVAGIVDAVLRGSPIHVWVQRDDPAAQAYMAALDGQGDGVYEHIVSDERRSEPSLIQICDAQLALYSAPLVTVTYAARDLKTKSGKTVTINTTTPAMHETLTIQEATITELGIRGLAPKFTVTASTARQSFEAILQMLIRKADS